MRKTKVTEWIALAVVMHYCLFLFVTKSSTFYYPFTDLYRQITWISLVCTGSFRLLTGLYGELRESGGREKRHRIIIKGVLALASLVPCSIIAARFGYEFLPYIPFAAFCLYGTKPEKVLKVFAICMGTMLAVTMLCALSGAIRNYLYPGYGRKGRIRAAYGTNYPTDFASYIVFILLFFWCAQKGRGKVYIFLNCCLALGAAYLLFTYPHSETSTICSLATAAVMLYTGITERRRKKTGGKLLKITDGIAIWAFPILMLVVWGLVILYGYGIGPAEQINGLLSDRLNLVWAAFQKYGIQAFGAWTPQSGWGGGLIKTQAYEFLDSTYALLPIRYGWVITLAAGTLWVWMTRRAIRTGHRRIGYAMAVIALHSFSEHHFPEMNYNLLLAMPLCTFGMRSEATREPERIRVRSWIAGAAGVATVLLLLPRALSWARCLFAAEGWTGGGDRSVKAALFWLACIGLVVLFRLLLKRLPGEIRRHEKPIRSILAGLVIVCCVFAAIWLGTNERITAEAAAYDARMEEERPAIEAVLEAATEPVYAGEQTEELYKRKYGGISDRIFSAEEIARSGKGSVLLEHDNEGYPLMFNGAQYSELSPYTGLFTYDRALVEKMSGEGYAFHGYYSAEREAGEEPIDQYGGDYLVTFELELTGIDAEDDANHEICDIKAFAMQGEELLAEKTLYEEDFGGDGLLNAELEYSTGNTRGVEYRVEIRDGVEIEAGPIRWRRNGQEE